MNISRKAVLQIAKEGIRKRPRWHFTFRNTLLWTAGIGCILLGALAFAVWLFALKESDFHLLDHIGHSSLEFLLVLLPFLWSIGFLFFLTVAVFSFRATKKGYRLRKRIILLIVLFLSGVLGALFLRFGGTEFLRESFAEKPSLQSLMEMNRRMIWSQPEQGTLSGKIIEVVSQGEKTELSLRDFNDQIWQVTSEKPYIFSHLKFIPGETIRIFGEKTADKSFLASEFHPWQGHMHHEKMHFRYME